MNATITAHARIDDKMFKQFVKFTLLKRGRHIKPVYLITSGALMLCLIGSLLYQLLSGWNEDLLGYMAAVPIILVLCVYFYFSFIRHSKSPDALSKALTHYEFTDVGIVSESYFGGMAGRSVVKYAMVERACEVKNAFYIYVTAIQACIIPKVELLPGDKDRLAELLREKLGKKYRKCY